jgi:poly(3-hydroxybutyrate) depolymerase
MKKLTIILAVVAVGISSPFATELPPPGVYEKELLLESGEILPYSLSVPKLNDEESAPLVLALHYGGEVTPYYGMHFMKLFALPAFRRLNAVIIAPDCPGRGWTDSKSETALMELLDHALGEWPVDPDRVVVTGFSMGGIGAWFMAASHPKRFAAAIPVAGHPVGDPDPSVAVCAVHSRQDTIVELEPAERAIEALREQGGLAELVLVSGPTHYQTPRFVEPTMKAVLWLERIWNPEGSDEAEQDDILRSPEHPRRRPKPGR